MQFNFSYIHSRWNSFRTACNTDKKIGLALELSADLPSYCEIQRWLGEPIRCVFINTSLFSTNKKGFPVLTKAHQNLLKKMFKVREIFYDIMCFFCVALLFFFFYEYFFISVAISNMLCTLVLILFTEQIFLPQIFVYYLVFDQFFVTQPKTKYFNFLQKVHLSFSYKKIYKS